MRRFALLVLALTACGEDPLRPLDDDSGLIDQRCDITVDATFPRDGATNAYNRQPIEFTLSEADPDATVQADFPGTVSFRDEGRTVVFTPDAPLAPNSDYTATLDYCGGEPTIGFHTSELGEPLKPDVDLVDRVYAVDLLDARFFAGDGVEEIVATFLSPSLLLSVVDLDADGIWLRVSLPREDDPSLQDRCIKTFDLPVADFDDSPWMSLDASEVLFGSDSNAVPLRQLQFTSTVASDGSWMGGGTFYAVLDARDIAELLDSTTGGMCSLAEGLGLACEPCPHDGVEACVVVEADDVVGEYLPETEVVEVQTYDAPGCAD